MASVIRFRNYWVEYTLIALAVAAFLTGIAHRINRSMPATDGSIRDVALSARAMSNRLPGKTAFSVDTITSGPVSKTFGGTQPVAFSVGKGTSVIITGWAVDEVVRAPAAAVMLQIDGNDKVDAQYGGARPDVARAYGVPAFVGSAFAASVPTKQLSGGRHDLSLLIFNSQRTGFYQARNQIVLTVR